MDIQKKAHDYWPVILPCMIFSIILYSMMMSQQLTNTFDGLWYQNYLLAGDGELSSGRWMLRFIDKISMGLHADPITSIVTLFLFILGAILILDLFGITDKLISFLFVALLTSSATVSITLSYRFTSMGYGLAFLLAVFGIYGLMQIRSNILAVGLSGISLGLSVACYQAYLGVYCVIAVYYIIFLVSKDPSDNNSGTILLHAIAKTVIAIVIAVLFYFVSLRLLLKYYSVSLSDYNGIGNISLFSTIQGIPNSIIKSYRYFFLFFFRNTLKINILSRYGVFYIFFALALLMLVLNGIKLWKANRTGSVLSVLFAVCIPVAANAYMLIAGNKLELHMAVGLAMVIPLTILPAFSLFKTKWARSLCIVYCFLLIYGSSVQVWIDQEAMYEGSNACETIATQILDDLEEEELLSTDKEYFFVGVPIKNEFFSVSNIYRSYANGYAQMGNFWVAGRCCQMSYYGLINKRMGFNLPRSEYSDEEFAEDETVISMPTFPNKGYIMEIDEKTVLIKVSDYGGYIGESKYKGHE